MIVFLNTSGASMEALAAHIAKQQKSKKMLKEMLKKALGDNPKPQ